MTTPIQYLKGVGPQKAALLAKLNITTIGELLEHYPRRYEDRTQFRQIFEVMDGQVETFCGIVTAVNEVKPRRGLIITKVRVKDHSGEAELVWFNQPYVKRMFKAGLEIIVSGKVERRFRSIQIANPEVEFLSPNDTTLHTGRIVPIYPSSENINQQFLRTLIKQALDNEPKMNENLPQDIIQQYKLIDRTGAIKNIHFPDSMEALTAARRRLVFEELYYLQSGLLFLKKKHQQSGSGIKHGPDGAQLAAAQKCLPFSLTADQQQAFREIAHDMEDVTPMQRLLQGDVGSGKTVVAALALVKTVENGYQGAMMAPTEILAEQHFHTLSRMLAPLGIRIAQLTGSLTKRVRKEVLDRLSKGLVDIIIGTHALIQEDVVFQHLGLVITDEQHRFGVNQRALLQAKGNMPDVLVMTATPIPRTMALTVYGDLDVSLIRQMPPGRKAIKTYTASPELRERVYNFVLREVQAGRQAYVVCPLVEESAKLEAQSATQLYEQLQTTIFNNVPCGLVHGRLKPQEKDQVMQAFYQADIKVLVATTVIEVGVNVPNATVMVIEGADRFGLAQLHQLRGRIGRGEHQSYCVLLSDSKNPETKERLDIMTQTSDGFVLAEKDLLLRGPGQFFGSRQHGLPDLKIADIVKDIEVLLEARKAAMQSVQIPEHVMLMRSGLTARFGEKFRLMFCN
ncbi:ATP-dependent DNA helicase RecG [Anaerospora hongkongensis]|uniref:ATP-dependent DNA helicase RecG n=1 Tax=Anaerospora hongkongensis TaxID=244830 RepID=UPI0028A2A857|nr:ATP-dependent DNA helicase RecG [Anaerospora hongkongensis]